MEKHRSDFTHFFLKHGLLLFILLIAGISIVFLGISLFIIFGTDGPHALMPLYISYISAVIVATVYIIIQNIVLTVRLYSSANAKRINECDPYPLLEASEFMINSSKKLNRLAVTNKSAALYDLGRFSEMKETLDQIGGIYLDELDSASHAAYCIDMASACMKLDMLDTAEARLAEAEAKLLLIKNDNIRTATAHSLISAKADLAFIKGELSAAKELALSLGDTHKLGCLYRDFLLASIFIGEDNSEHAVPLLEGVIANGNKMYIAEQAAILLKELNNSDTEENIP